MIAIRDRGTARFGTESSKANAVFELLQSGDKHWDLTVSNLFFQARQLAASAVSENSETTLVVSALLYRPCQILACGSVQAGDWTSDSLLETGTYDWLVRYFGEDVAETIRMQPLAKRFLSTVLPRYFGHLQLDEQRSVMSGGGFMSASERVSFGKNRCQNNAMKIARWSDRGADRCLEIPEMHFFKPFIEEAMVTASL